MFQEMPFSAWAPPKAHRSIDHSRKYLPLTGQSDTWADDWQNRHHGTIQQAQLRFLQTGWPARAPSGQADFEDRRWPGPLNVGSAPVRRENTLVTGKAGEDGWLNDAMEDLADCPAVAVEEGLDEPSGLGLSKSEAVLRGISRLTGEQPDIYPMEGGGIVIDLRSPDRQDSVLMVVECDGAGVLFYRASGKKGRVRVDDAADVPNLLKALGLSATSGMEDQ